MMIAPHLFRSLIGPLATAATLAAIELGNRYSVTIPDPAAIYFCAVVFSAFVGGIGGGVASAAIVLAGTAWSSPAPELAILALATLGVAAMVGWLRHRLVRQHGDRHELTSAHSALDHVASGIVLFDRDLRARFINRSYRTMWQLPDAIAERAPEAGELLQHGIDIGIDDMAPRGIDGYIGERIAHLRSGDPQPRDLRLSDGRTLRFEVAALPDGDRMASYTDVTRMVRDAEHDSLLATEDDLTGLFNRSHFLYLGEREWERFQRYDRPLTLIMLDIDSFKSVNDRFGDEAGDLVIKEVAIRCRQALRTTDLIGRVGGGEFAILLPETPVLVAATIAERLRGRIADVPIGFLSDSTTMTISLGVAAAARTTDGVTGMLKAAERALRDAKHRGRNRVALQSRVT